MKNKLIEELKIGNKEYSKKNKDIFINFINNQSPSIAVLTCSDSRVIPEYIFNKSIGEIFVIRIAGNIAIDPTVITSIEYAVDHLQISYLIILGHTNCGAVKASEESNDKKNILLKEIKDSFILDPNNHVRANVLRQLDMLPKRSEIIKDKINNKKLTLIGALYDLREGHVDFIT
jgi:carbonic anhydrase